MQQKNQNDSSWFPFSMPPTEVLSEGHRKEEVYTLQTNRYPCATHTPLFLHDICVLLILVYVSGCAFLKVNIYENISDQQEIVDIFEISISAMYTNKPLFLYFMIHIEVKCFTNLMREAVMFSYRDILHKIPEAFVTQRKHIAYVYIVHTCQVDSSCSCERQMSVFELELNSACSMKRNLTITIKETSDLQGISIKLVPGSKAYKETTEQCNFTLDKLFFHHALHTLFYLSVQNLLLLQDLLPLAHLNQGFMVASEYRQLDNTALDPTHLKIKRHFFLIEFHSKDNYEDTVYS